MAIKEYPMAASTTLSMAIANDGTVMPNANNSNQYVSGFGRAANANIVPRTINVAMTICSIVTKQLHEAPGRYHCVCACLQIDNRLEMGFAHHHNHDDKSDEPN